MKKLLVILTMLLCCSAFEVKAQTKTEVDEQAMADSIAMEFVNALYDIYEKIGRDVPRYKIYQTENVLISLKLDTATGRVWMVQIGVGDSYAMEVAVDDKSLLYYSDKVVAGRYELYPTKNMYNFILLDTQEGNVYQVQWHTNANKCIRTRIY
ncbi:MAG: hypothetical protein IKW54_03370 [Bacteroidales bacterium]|nr:hypothetical protein [Bacteroidales bacterium]MBR5782501.1 hypothetical protein [Bacteroidales bacterium]